MQKIDFINNIKILEQQLKSKQILELFTETPAGKMEGIGQIVKPLLFSSKSGYDNLKKDTNYSYMLDTLGFDEIYNDLKIAQISTLLDSLSIKDFLTKHDGFSFYTKHYSLVQAKSLSTILITDNEINESLLSEVDNDIIVFQVVIEDEGLPPNKYAKIFTIFDELFEAIGKAYNETKSVEIVLLDSGSDTSIAVKAGVNSIKGLFTTIKEVWDLLIGTKAKKQLLENSAIRENLTLLEEFRKRKEEGLISDEEEKKYSYVIKARINDLLKLNVVPKKLLDTEKITRQLLLSSANIPKEIKSS